jgi:plasmid stabilization system protein ParE
LATKIEAEIFAAADWLADHRELGTRTDEADILRWPMTDFRSTIFYRIDGDNNEIEILRIMDGRRVRDLRRVPQ